MSIKVYSNVYDIIYMIVYDMHASEDYELSLILTMISVV